MKWKEKIRQMNDDELAEFIDTTDELNGFKDLACRGCRYFHEDGWCGSTDMTTDCRKAVRNLLESEV